MMVAIATADWYDSTASTEAELLDRIAYLANPELYVFSDENKAGLQQTAQIIIDNVLRYYHLTATAASMRIVN